MERNSEIFSDSPYRNVLKETKKTKNKKKKSKRKQGEKFSKSTTRKRRSEARVL